MHFDHWLSLSDAERTTAEQQWNVYGDGYWHSLVASAAERFISDFTSRPHVRSITHGIYHGGELIIGVKTDLPYPKIIRLPESYLGFRVMQFAGGTPEGTVVTPAPAIYVDV
jgi:hypothetical protein